MGILTRVSDKKSTKTGKMIKQKKHAGISRNRKEKTTQEKTYNTTWGNKPESTGERRKTKEILTKEEPH